MWGVASNSRAPWLPQGNFPAISHFPSSKDQGSETGFSQLVSWGWAGDELGITFSLLSGGYLRNSSIKITCRRICSPIPKAPVVRGLQRCIGLQHCTPSPYLELGKPQQRRLPASHTLYKVPKERGSFRWHHGDSIMQGQQHGFPQTTSTQPRPNTKGRQQRSPLFHHCRDAPPKLPSFHTPAKQAPSESLGSGEGREQTIFYPKIIFKGRTCNARIQVGKR